MKNWKVGDRVYFGYSDGTIMGFTIEKIRNSEHDIEDLIVDLKSDNELEVCDCACYFLELEDSLSLNDSRVIDYEKNHQENRMVRLKDVCDWLKSNWENLAYNYTVEDAISKLAKEIR